MEGGGNLNPTPPAQKDKAILIHVSKFKDVVGEEQTLEEMELKLQSPGNKYRRNSEYYVPLDEVNSWYLLEHTTNGPKITEIFHNIRNYQPEGSWLTSTSSAIVGSSLYVLGGRINLDSEPSRSHDRNMSDRVHCLDINNPDDGWKTSSIPFQFAPHSCAQVIGSSICSIPGSSDLERLPLTDDRFLYQIRDDDQECGLVYDTIEQVAYAFKPPPGCFISWTTYYIPLEGRGLALVFPVQELETSKNRVYLHDPSQNSWQQLHDYSALAKTGFSTAYAVSNGVLYLLEVHHDSSCYEIITTTLSAYDINNGRKLFRKKLPLSDDDNMWLVPVSDCKLCLLRHSSTYGIGHLFYAMILVSHNPYTVRIVEESQLSMDSHIVLNCLPVSVPDDYPYRNKEISDVNNDKYLELYWKRCCRHLLEENMQLQKEVDELTPYTRPYPEKRRRVSECKEVEAKPMLTKELSILIQVSRVANLTDAQGCEALEMQFHQSKKPPFFGCKKTKPNLPTIDSWYIINHTTAGPQISEILHNVPQDHPNIFCKGSSTAIVDTSLYVIGGRYNFSDHGKYFSNEVRHLDFQNPAKGWEISKLPYCFADGRVEVADNYIYLLPRESSHVVEDLEAETIEKALVSGWGIPCDASNYPWGLIYDTTNHEAKPVKLPSNTYFYGGTFGFHLEGRGVVIPLEKNEVYIHDPSQNSWELQDSCFDSPLCVNSSVVSNGILFLFKDTGKAMTLSAYNHDPNSGEWLELLFVINVPLDLLGYSVRVVAVADFTFCLLRHKYNYSRLVKGPLFYTKVLVSLDPEPNVTILEETCFQIEGMEILNILPMDSDLCPKENEESLFFDKGNGSKLLPSSSRESEAMDMSKELYWKQCFQKLREEHKRLQMEVKELNEKVLRRS